MKSLKLLSLTVLGCSAILFACSSQKPVKDPGPMEKAGAAVDEGAEDAKDTAKEAGKKVGDATEKAGDKIEEKSE